MRLKFGVLIGAIVMAAFPGIGGAVTVDVPTPTVTGPITTGNGRIVRAEHELRPRQCRLRAGRVLRLGHRDLVRQCAAAHRRRPMGGHPRSVGPVHDPRRRVPTDRPEAVQRHGDGRVVQRDRRPRRRRQLDDQPRRAHAPGHGVGRCHRAEGRDRRWHEPVGCVTGPEERRPRSVRTARASGRRVLLRHLLAGRPSRPRGRGNRARGPEAASRRGGGRIAVRVLPHDLRERPRRLDEGLRRLLPARPFRCTRPARRLRHLHRRPEAGPHPHRRRRAGVDVRDRIRPREPLVRHGPATRHAPHPHLGGRGDVALRHVWARHGAQGSGRRLVRHALLRLDGHHDHVAVPGHRRLQCADQRGGSHLCPPRRRRGNAALGRRRDAAATGAPRCG